MNRSEQSILFPILRNYMILREEEHQLFTPNTIHSPVSKAPAML